MVRARNTFFTILLVAPLLVTACQRKESPFRVTPSSRPNVVIISIDTLRADHLPLYGYAAGQTPNIDALARDGVIFRNAYSHCPLTLPSHVSLLTGQLPAESGVRDNVGYVLSPATKTIAALLKAQGYATGAAVSAYVLRASTGVNQGFDLYDGDLGIKGGETLGEVQRKGDVTTDLALKWLEGHRTTPALFFLHLYEPHSPYDPPEPYKSRFASAYDGEIATADAMVGRFLAELKRLGMYDDSVVFLLSDHGEGLNDHGEAEHGVFLYREDLHVPLIMKLPKSESRGGSIANPVQLIDVAPTILDILGLKSEPAMHGTSLRQFLATTKIADREIFSETIYPRVHLGCSELRSLTGNRFHLIDAPRPELFELTSDPGEKTNILSENRRVYAEMKRDLAPFVVAPTRAGNVTEEEAASMRALGYLSASADTGGALPDPKDHIGELELLKQAAGAQKAGRLKDAIAILERTVAANERLTDAWFMLGQVQEEMGLELEAVKTYRKAITIAPSVASEVGLSLARIYLKNGDLEQAVIHARLGATASPGVAHLILGRVALTRKDLATAQAEAAGAVNESSSRSGGVILQAQILTAQRQYDAALATLAKGGVDPTAKPVALYHFARADALARSGRTAEAEAEFQEEIRLFPQELDAYGNLAALYWFSGSRAKARSTIDQMVRTNPGPAARRSAAETLLGLGDNEGAGRFR
ncbi:MAG TPA: sulfatase-like hydrolase/transferase [Thermoanaerobaculia bacterium]|nr:sulfatase-like hydrolase/transferase [Thermoanaerobaculia bacterium]